MSDIRLGYTDGWLWSGLPAEGLGPAEPVIGGSMNNQHSHRRAFAVALVAALSLALPLVATQGAGAAPHENAVAPRNTIPDEPSGDPDVVVELSARALADAENLPIEEATRRVELQPARDLVIEAYAKAAGTAWGGAYVDQEGNGALVVESTDVAAFDRADLSAQARGLGVEVRKREVPFTYDQLNEATTAIARTFSSEDITGTVTGNPQDGFLTVTVTSEADVARAQRLLTYAITDDQLRGTVRIVADKDAAFRTFGCSSSYTSCDAPMRGGQAMSTAPGGICTTGFTVASNSNGWVYEMTAGHCAVIDPAYGIYGSGIGTGSLQWNAYQPGNGYDHVVGRAHSTDYAELSQGDASLIDVDNPASAPAGWGPGGYVRVMTSGGTHPTADEPRYDITGVGSTGGLTQYQSWLCKTGALTNTNCGQIYGWGATFVGPSPGGYDTVNAAIISGMKSCTGDSGSPVYAGHLGYGIVNGGSGPVIDHKSGDIGPTVIPSSAASECTGTTWYTGLAYNLSALNVHLL